MVLGFESYRVLRVQESGFWEPGFRGFLDFVVLGFGS